MISVSSPGLQKPRQLWQNAGGFGNGQEGANRTHRASPGYSGQRVAGDGQTIHFGGIAAKPFVQKVRAFFPKLWSEYQDWLPKQRLRLADAVEHFLNKIRRAFASCMMVLSTAVPLPKWLYARLTRDYFFSPRKVMGLKFKKNPDLNKKIIVNAFQMNPHSENLDTLHSFYLPAKANSGKPTIVFSHGRDTNIGHLESLFKAADEKGYGFFAYDYPGFGKSDGTPTEDLLKQSGAAACRFLASDGYMGGYGIPYKDQILMGYSLGGGVATDVAKQFSEYIANLGKHKEPPFNVANEERLKGQCPRGLILVNTFTSIPDAFRAKLKEQRKWVANSLKPDRISIQFNSKEALSKVKNIPVRVFSCENDSAVSPALGDELAKVVNDKRYPITGKGHNINGDTLKEILDNLPPEVQKKQSGVLSTVA